MHLTPFFLIPEGFQVSAEAMLAASDYCIDHITDVFIEAGFFSHLLCLLQQGHLIVTIEAFVAVYDCLLLLFVKACAAEPSFIYAAYFGRIVTADNKKRRDILVNAGQPGGIAPPAYSNELMQQDNARQPYACFDFAVAAYLGEVAKDGFIFDDAIVTDVDANHNEVIAAYFGEGIVVHTGVNGDLFADSIVVADYKAAELGVGTKIENLRFASDDTVGKEMITFSDCHVFVDDDVGFKDGSFADEGAGANKAVGSYYDAVLQKCSIFDDCGRMNLFHFEPLKLARSFDFAQGR
jgi:hypothetical protein